MNKIRSLFLFVFFVSFSSYFYGNSVPVNIEEAINSVVQILPAKGAATGFFIDPHTLVTTAHAIFKGKQLIPIEKIHITQIGRAKKPSAKITGVKALSFIHDLAILQVAGYNGSYLAFGDLTPGEKVYTIGFPYLELNITTGQKVENRNSNYEVIGYFPNRFLGASGSPLLNSQGKVIGVVNAAMKGSIYIKKSDSLKNLIKTLSPIHTQNDHPKQLADRVIEQTFQIAHLGDTQAQLALAWMYAGYGLKQNPKNALKYYTLAATNGHPFAQLKLGEMYLLGLGMKQPDLNEAQKWSLQAAKQNFVEAFFSLGTMFYEKPGMKPLDLNEARKWFLQAAEQNHALAQMNLGEIYYNGLKGIEKPDFEKALHWFRKAAEQGVPEAQFKLGKMYANGEGMEEANLHEAMKWLTKAAEQGITLQTLQKAEETSQPIRSFIHRLCRKIF